MNQQTERLGSRLGFILLSAGCAIGLGNVWTFPWRVGNFGGGAFVLVYIVWLIVLGLPIMTCEYAIGRAAQKSPILAYQQLEKKGQKWHVHGILCFIGNVALMAFYTTIAGYFFHYLISYIKGDFSTLTFAATRANTGVNVLFMAIVVFLGFFVLSFRLQRGLEKVNKYMMVALFILMVGLAIHSCTMSGVKEGLAFYLKPDFSKINGSVIIGAMNQAFFSLSLGIGSMMIFGAYSEKNNSLLGESSVVILLDTVVALMAGFILFPACFTYGISPDAGPSLLFTTMTTVFTNMAGGRFWGALFFLFMIFAAMSTVFAVFENILMMFRNLTGISRAKSCWILCGLMFLICLPMALGGSVLTWSPFGEGTEILDFWCWIVETVSQPLGSLFIILFCTSKRYGWGWDNFIAEANTGRGIKVRSWMKILFCYITPAIVGALWLYGLFTFSYK